ncbi:MAG: ASCH domain-containing protein [Alphaproteobacteria bacterium]|nr:ASCH domain-containing protein [Alphaproteobacteria bacterium]
MPATQPSAAALKSFLAKARAALSGATITDTPRMRCIGWSQETSLSICTHILARDKTGTFSVPWLHAAHPSTKPDIGEWVVFHTYDGEPRALLQTRQLTLLTFGEIDASHTALDGPSVRDLKVWQGIHTKYWNDLLAPLGKKVVADMPVIVERFACVYPPA